MKRSRKNRIIIATIIHGGSDMAGPDHLKICAMSFLGAAWGDYLVPKTLRIIISTEGEHRPAIHDRHTILNWGTVEKLESGIHDIEHLKKKRGRGNQQPKEPHLMLGIGSKEFCQVYAHFWSTGKGNHAANWGLHMIRRLTNSEPGTVLWYDTQGDQLSFGKISEMFAGMKAAFKKQLDPESTKSPALT